MVSSAAQNADGETQTLLAQRLESLAGLPPPLVGQPLDLPHDPRGFDAATSSGAGELLTWSRYLGGMRAGRLGSSGELESFVPYRRATFAAFDPAGVFLCIALRTRVDVLSHPGLEPLASFADLPYVPNRLAWNANGTLVAAASDLAPDVLLLDLSRTAPVEVSTPPTSALAPGASGGFLHGTLEGELRLLVSGDESEPAVHPLDDPILALASVGNGPALVAGHPSSLARYPAPGEPADWTRPTGAGEVRALFVDGERKSLWAATGSLVEQPDGTYAEDCYVRLFDLETGEELGRSHAFSDLPCALLPQSASMWSLGESGELWRWVHPR